MTLDDILTSLFPDGHQVAVDNEGIVTGSGPLADGGRATVIGVANGAALGVEGAAKLARMVLATIEAGQGGPLLVVVDSDSQRMSRRDEMLGLSEYLAHLSKCLILADLGGIPTIGLLYGHSAAGAFVVTALSTRILVALPGANPEVMDLPSMSRVTKLSINVLKEKAKSSPVFAPGLENLAQTGAIFETWDPRHSLAAQLADLLQRAPPPGDHRDSLGKARGGCPKAADISARVETLAAGHG
jgi:malonate decarboxylase gamma subunit